MKSHRCSPTQKRSAVSLASRPFRRADRTPGGREIGKLPIAKENLRALPRNAKINSETLQFFPRGEKNFVARGLQAEVTTLLDEIRAGKAEAKSQLVELVY